MVDVVLFELENVLFDTRELRRLAVTDACAAHAVPITADLDSLDGMPTRAAVRTVLAMNGMGHDDVLGDLIADAAERAFSARLAERGATVCAGAAPFVVGAAGRARLAIVARARRGDVELVLRLSGLEGAFNVIVSGDDVLDAKPSPAGHRAALERLAKQRPVRRAAALALEDGLAGIQAAHAANARCVAVGAVPAHVAIEADAYVPSLANISLDALDRLSTPGAEHVR